MQNNYCHLSAQKCLQESQLKPKTTEEESKIMPNTLEDAVLKKTVQRGGAVNLTVEFIGPTGLIDCTFMVRDATNNPLQQVTKTLVDLQVVAGGKARYSFELSPVEKQLVRNNKFYVTSLPPSPSQTFNPPDWIEVDILQAFPKGKWATWWEKIVNLSRRYLQQRPRSSNTSGSSTSFSWKLVLGIFLSIALLVGILAAGIIGYKMYKHWPMVQQKIATFWNKQTHVNNTEQASVGNTNPDSDLPPPVLDPPETNLVHTPTSVPSRKVADAKVSPRSEGNNISNSGQMGNVQQTINYFGSGTTKNQKTGWPYGCTPDKTVDITAGLKLPPGATINLTNTLPALKDYEYAHSPGWNIIPLVLRHQSTIQGAYNIQSCNDPLWVPWLEVKRLTYGPAFRFRSLIDDDITIVFIVTAL